VDNHDLPMCFIQNVLNHERRNDTNPELCGFGRQITKRLAKLRVNLQPAIDLADRGENLFTLANLTSTQHQIAQCFVDSPRIRDVVRLQGVHGRSLGVAGELFEVCVEILQDQSTGCSKLPNGLDGFFLVEVEKGLSDHFGRNGGIHGLLL